MSYRLKIRTVLMCACTAGVLAGARAFAGETGEASALAKTGATAASSIGATLAFKTPPYLQNMSSSGMVVMCELPRDAALRLEYGTQSGAYASSLPFQSESTSGRTWICRAVIAGLDPQQTYHYRLTQPDGTPATADAVFHTTPIKEVDFNFGVWGDSQEGNRTDWKKDLHEPLRSMMRHMAAANVAFGLSVGDMANDGRNYAQTAAYYLDCVARELGPVAPWYVAWGNHDKADTNGIVRRASDMPSRYRAGFSSGHGAFSFTYANCYFVCLDDFYQAELTNGWLRQELGAAPAQRARFRIVAVHKPPWCERGLNGNDVLRNKLVPLLEKCRVDICFSGHTHEYERGALNGVQYVITGGGSCLDYAAKVVKDWPHMTVGGAQNLPGSKRRQSALGVLGPPEPIVGGLVHEYCYVEVRGDTLRLECRCFNADGSYIGALDSVELRAKRTPSPPDSPPNGGGEPK